MQGALHYRARLRQQWARYFTAPRFGAEALKSSAWDFAAARQRGLPTDAEATIRRRAASGILVIRHQALRPRLPRMYRSTWRPDHPSCCSASGGLGRSTGTPSPSRYKARLGRRLKRNDVEGEKSPRKHWITMGEKETLVRVADVARTHGGDRRPHGAWLKRLLVGYADEAARRARVAMERRENIRGTWPKSIVVRSPRFLYAICRKVNKKVVESTKSAICNTTSARLHEEGDRARMPSCHARIGFASFCES